MARSRAVMRRRGGSGVAIGRAWRPRHARLRERVRRQRRRFGAWPLLLRRPQTCGRCSRLAAHSGGGAAALRRFELLAALRRLALAHWPTLWLDRAAAGRPPTAWRQLEVGATRTCMAIAENAAVEAARDVSQQLLRAKGGTSATWTRASSRRPGPQEGLRRKRARASEASTVGGVRGRMRHPRRG